MVEEHEEKENGPLFIVQNVTLGISTFFFVLLSIFCLFISIRFFRRWMKGRQRTAFKNIIAFNALLFVYGMYGLWSSFSTMLTVYYHRIAAVSLITTVLGVIFTPVKLAIVFRILYIWVYMLPHRQVIVVCVAVLEGVFAAALVTSAIVDHVVHKEEDQTQSTSLSFFEDTTAAITGLIVFVILSVLHFALGMTVYRLLSSSIPSVPSSSSSLSSLLSSWLNLCSWNRKPVKKSSSSSSSSSLSEPLVLQNPTVPNGHHSAPNNNNETFITDIGGGSHEDAPNTTNDINNDKINTDNSNIQNNNNKNNNNIQYKVSMRTARKVYKLTWLFTAATIVTALMMGISIVQSTTHSHGIGWDIVAMVYAWIDIIKIAVFIFGFIWMLRAPKN